jgi:hypothetical protein
MKSILDPNFKYVPAARTDIRKTFARVRRERRIAQLSEQAEKVHHLPTTQRRSTT